MKDQQSESPDLILLFIVFTLLAVGLMMVLSASSVSSYNLFGDAHRLFRSQLMWTAAGTAVMLFFMKLDYHYFLQLGRPVLLGSILLLIVVLLPGIGWISGGARRWLVLGPIRLQPSEIAKLALIIYTAGFLYRKQEKTKNFVRGVLPPVLVFGLIFLLIIMQPDLGTGVTMAGSFVILLFAAGIKFKHLFLLILSGAGIFVYFVFSEGYRYRRLMAFLDPWSDRLDSGYHVIQSLIALGTGGLTGVGLGGSRQKFLYLPEPGTDFIYAILGEELGFIGAFSVLILYLLLAWRGYRIALRAGDRFGALLAVGLTSMIILQAVINVGVVTSSLPITGITLPFISYGGTSMVIMMAGVGILLNISKNQIN